MRSTTLLSWALAVLLAPPGPGLALPCLAAAAGASPGESWGLLLLASAPCLSAYATSNAAAAQAAASAATADRASTAATPGDSDVVSGALELTGRWRRPPGGTARLDTLAGPVRVQLAPELVEPAPGTLVVLRARHDPDRPAATLQAVRLDVLGPARGAWLDRWAAAAGARIEHLVSPTRRGVVTALLLGERRDLPPALRRDAVDTGTAHLFALSGMHVVIVAGLLGRALRGLGLRGAPGLVVQALLLGSFAALAGLRPPLLRATLGWALLSWAWYAGRRVTGLFRLGVVALLLLVTTPGVQYELSAQLSFAAVAGLVAITRRRRGMAAWVLAPVGAFLATAPLAAEVFGQVQPWGVVVTPLLLPLVALLLLVGWVAVVPGEAAAALDGVTGPLLEGLSGGLAHALELLAAWLPPPWHPPSGRLLGWWPGWLLSAAVISSMWCLAPRAETGAPRRTDPGTDPLPERREGSAWADALP